ncbi:MAG: hypothetical protein A2007_06500 [Verrucomicrobia bacterium GWC2_42_7]|nr:MAG: hypothetical protein A2007_06500 [Verrucomicrobia bacterium GWC2_42_7]
MAKCSLRKVVVNDIFEPKYSFATNIEGRFLYIVDGKKAWLIATFDFSYMFRSTCLKWRKAVSMATGISVANIWVHTSQSHTAPSGWSLEDKAFTSLVDTTIPIIKKMVNEAEEAELSYAVANLDGKYNFNREAYVPELGVVTLWGGLAEVRENEYPTCQDPDKMLLHGYKAEISEPVVFDRAVDSSGSLLVFRTKSGKIIGSLLRFTGHPDIAGSPANIGVSLDLFKYHFDWPGYVRETLEEQLGGVSMCVNGPCGNVAMRYSAPDTYEKAYAIANHFAHGIAGDLIKTWEKNIQWQSVTLKAISSCEVDLPILEMIPENRDALPSEENLKCQTEKKYEELKQMIERKETPAKIKRMAEELLSLCCLRNKVLRWTNITDDEMSRRVMTIELNALAINDIILLGFPGETMTDTSMLIQAATYGKKLITFDQVNGYHTYLPMNNSYAEGGYSYWCTSVAHGAEPVMRQRALELIQVLERD